MSRAEVEAGERRWLEAFNGGDASGVAQHYTEGARLLPPNSDIVEGRASIEEFIKGFVATGAQASFTLLTVHEAGDLCASVGTYDMTIPTDDGPQQDRGKFIEIWARQSDGSWRIIDDIFNSSLPAPA
jgi:uncharacterized protein (TIGR02246 family)